MFDQGNLETVAWMPSKHSFLVTFQRPFSQETSQKDNVLKREHSGAGKRYSLNSQLFDFLMPKKNELGSLIWNASNTINSSTLSR